MPLLLRRSVCVCVCEVVSRVVASGLMNCRIFVVTDNEGRYVELWHYRD